MRVHIVATNGRVSDEFLALSELVKRAGYELLVEDSEYAWFRADLLIVYAEQATIDIGYQIAHFALRRKPVLLLYQDLNLVESLTTKYLGPGSNQVKIREVTPYTLADVLAKFFQELKVDTRRISFQISSDLDQYLVWVQQTRNLGFADLCRDLLRGQLEDDQEYQAHLEDL